MLRVLFAGALCGASVGAVCAQSLSGSYAFSTFAGRAGLSGSTDATGVNARFNRPWGVAVDAAGNVYVADAGNYIVRKITPAGVVTTIAGTVGTTGTTNGPAASAQFGAVTLQTSGPGIWGPWGVAADAGGDLFVADSFSHTIRRLSAGQVTTFAGIAGTSGYAEGALASARFSVPWGVAVDSSGVLYVADTFNHVVRRITPAGVVTIISGSPGDWGSADGIGAASRLLHPTAIAVDSAGRVYVADSGNTIRRITPLNATQTQWETATLAGTFGTYGNVDGAGAAARFGSAPSPGSTPTSTTIRYGGASPGIPATFTGFSYAVNELPGIAVDAVGNIFLSDYSNNLIRKISPAGVVTTIGGTNSFGNADGVGANARFSRPAGMAVDLRGNLYIADSSNHTIRRAAAIAQPEIRTAPAGQTVGVGGTTTLSVVATGSPDPTYQWSRNGASVPGATGASLILSNVQPAQSGDYTVAVTNLAGSVTSAPATVSVINLPTISAQPLSQSVLSGTTVTFSVGVGGLPAPTVQWFRDGAPIPGATGLTLVIPNVQPSAAGDYSVVATSSLGAVSSAPARLVINSSRIVNLSIRTALAGGEPLIVGFVASGGSKTLLLRAIGPTLRGFNVAAAMADPILSLHLPGGAVAATNDNWGTGSAAGQLTLAASEVGAFALPVDSLDAAILAAGVDGPMTLQATSRTNADGIVLIELYDAAPAAPSRLANVSARTIVGGGENALFAGFVISGNGAKTLLIRAIGPTLGAFGVSGVLNDPRLDVFPAGSSTAQASNDNWAGNIALSAAFRAVSAFALPSAESRDAALLVVLQPGSYTAQVSGVGGQTGEVLLEIYEMP